MKNTRIEEKVTLQKFVHGGQALGGLADGRKAFVWGGLPGEVVDIQLTKSKHSYVEGYVVRVHTKNPSRTGEFDFTDIEATVAPWSILQYTAELDAKKAIIIETFKRESIVLPEFSMETAGKLSDYRNKIEFSFWGDDDGLHYAHFMRGSHKKIKLEYPYLSLINDKTADVAYNLLRELNERNIRASDLKSVVFRSDARPDSERKVVAALYVKSETFPKIDLENIVVIYSNPKSPASIVTKILYTNGDVLLQDTVLDTELTYDVLSFFQVNLPIFEVAAQKIKQYVNGKPSVDLYTGVGAIGIPVGASVLVDSDEHNIKMAKQNAQGRAVQIVHAPSEQALDYITDDKILIVDPPRAGLHMDVVERITAAKPPRIVYLSCNPSTQARDVALLQDSYSIKFVEGYNFFPRTPHIESLVILTLT